MQYMMKAIIFLLSLERRPYSMMDSMMGLIARPTYATPVKQQKVVV